MSDQSFDRLAALVATVGAWREEASLLRGGVGAIRSGQLSECADELERLIAGMRENQIALLAQIDAMQIAKVLWPQDWRYLRQLASTPPDGSSPC